VIPFAGDQVIAPKMTHLFIREYYACFNERRFDDAVGLFARDAILEQPPFGVQQPGGAGHLQFVEMWLRAFPDAVLTIQQVVQRGDTICEVDLLASGTHLGPFDMGAYGVFKPTGIHASLRLRELLEIRHGRITFSGLSFDIHDLVRQLTAAPAEADPAPVR
jgi:predicted ester cyclase